MARNDWLRITKSPSGVSPTRHRRSARKLFYLERLEDRLCLSTSGLNTPLTTPDAATQARVSQAYGQIPLSFEANQGQTDSSVDFLSRGSGYALYLTPDAAVLSLQAPVANAPGSSANVLQMKLIGGNTRAQATGLDALAGTSNYFIGNDPSQWHTNITNYGRVEYDNVYRGIDLIYYGNQRQLEYDFVLAPGADPGAIQLAFTGASSITLDASGDLVLHDTGGDVVEHAPVIYQDGIGIRQAVSGHYVLEANGQVGFVVGAYDATKSLVIDPVLSYSTYLGSSGNDYGYGIAVDSVGDAYVTGYTQSTNFPSIAGAFQTGPSGDCAFVTKFNAAGTALVYSTYLGNYFTFGNAISVDGSGNAYVTGQTESSSFPTTPGDSLTPSGEVFVTKLNSSGNALVYSTRFGGTSYELSDGIAIDNAGNAYITGTTQSADFPTTAGAFQTTSPGYSVFVAKLNPTGSALVYSTYLGSGNEYGYGIAVDGSGDAYVTGIAYEGLPTTPGALQTTGSGAFVTKLNAAGTGLVYSTFLGSAWGSSIAVDGAGHAYVTGALTIVGAPPGPITAGGGAFVDELNVSGSALIYSTNLGIAGSEGRGIALDTSGDAFVTGGAMARNPGSHNGVFVVELNPAGTAPVSWEYLGGLGAGYGIALDGKGNAYVMGTTIGGIPTTAGAFQTAYGGAFDAFATKINFNPSSTLFAITGFSAPDTAGVAGTFTVTAETISGSVITGYAGTVHFTSGDPRAVLPADYTFTAADQGVHTFSATLKTAGVQSITATDTTNGFVGAETGITVNPATASTFILSAYPSPTTAGLAGSFTLTARDAFGNVATGYTGTAHFSSSDGIATLPANYTYTSADAGVHTFSATLKTAGTQSLIATDSVTASIAGSESGIVVKPGAASLLVVGAPSTVTHGVAFVLTLTVEDAYGNVVTGYVGTVHFSSSDSTATLPASYTFTAADAGRRTFTNKITLKKKGKQTLTLTDTLNSALNASISITVT